MSPRISTTCTGKPCAGLEQVLESKRQAGRDKDKKLLALYEIAYKPLLRRRRKTR